MRPIVISLDAMGGDHGVTTVVPGALDAVARDPSIELILVGDEAVLAPLIAKAPADQRARLSIVHASQTVAMDESPADALRRKKDSSMRVAIDLVKAGRAQGCVSAGNTGALMATAKFVLKTLPGIDRPALISAIPSVGGHTHMLDLGANADCSSEQLYQFAVMGSVLASAVYGIDRPSIGLLNIGSEEIKGNDIIKHAAQLIQASGQLNYIGFVEGNDIFSDRVDVVVADGFAGNVALKTAEGLAKMVARFLKEEFSRNLYTKLAAFVSLPVLKSAGKRLDPRRYNGASLLGLNGVVIKSHGGADAMAIGYAIRVAKLEVENQVPTRIAEQLGRHINGNGSSDGAAAVPAAAADGTVGAA
jgi:glycerol-3-phosphate acyltransferase PlsX